MSKVISMVVTGVGRDMILTSEDKMFGVKIPFAKISY